MTDTANPPEGTPAAAPAAPAAPAVAWFPEADADTAAFIGTKAWKAPADAVKSYRELEKFVGADKAGRAVVLPTDDTPEAWAPIYDRLGRPKSPADYGLKVEPGSDTKFLDAATAKFHSLGLNTRQAAELAQWYSSFSAEHGSAAEAAEQAALEAEHQQLARDWGTGPEAAMRTELAKRAAVALGLDEAAIDALQKVAGYSKTMKAIAKVGDMLREHGAEGMEELGSFTQTPEGAKAKRATLMADREWTRRAMVPNSAEWQQLQKLDAVIATTRQ